MKRHTKGCDHKHNIVIDSRANGFSEIRRRRKCLECGFRWSTYEMSVAEANSLRDLRAGLLKSASIIVEFEKRHFLFTYAKDL